MVVCHMTTAGPDANQDNSRKYEIVKKVIKQNEHERILIVGDMLGEEVNENGQLLIDSTEDMRLENLNVTIGDGRVTWNAGVHKSEIDFMLVLNMNVSRPEVKSISKVKKCKWKLRNAKSNKFQDELTNEV